MHGGERDRVGPARLAGLQAELLCLRGGQVGEERAERGLLFVVGEGGGRVRERVQVGAGDSGIPPRLRRHLDVQAQCPLDLPHQVRQRPADVRAQRPQLSSQRGEPLEAPRRVRAPVPQVVQCLHQAAGHRGQIRDRLRQRILIMRYAAATIPGSHRVPAAGAILGIGCAGPGLAPSGCRFSAAVRAGAGRVAGLAGQFPRAPAQGDQVTRPDPPPWPGEQPGQRGGLRRVVQHPQGGHDVGDLGDGEQPAEADHLDRDPLRLDRRAQQGELGTLAAEHGDVGGVDAQPVPGLAVGCDAGGQPEQPGDLFAYPAGLRGGGVEQRADHRAAPGPLRGCHQPGHLGHLVPQVPLDHRGGVEHLAGVAEAGGELGYPGRMRVRGELTGEPGQVARACPAPAVDRLAGVAHGGHRVPTAEQRTQQDELGVAGVLELIQQHHLVPGALDRAHLAVPGRDPRGQRHLVAVVDDLPGPLGCGITGHQRQQLLPGALAVQDLADAAGQAGQRPGRRLQPVADLVDVGGAGQVLGQFPGEFEHGGGHRLGGPVDRVHRPGIGGHHPGRHLPRHCRGDQAHGGFQGFT